MIVKGIHPHCPFILQAEREVKNSRFLRRVGAKQDF
jgi:hypothetical protein